MNENREILEQLNCSVCRAHPKMEAFQCKNGHLICSVCIKPLTNCSQCQLAFEVPPIRCHLVESLLQIVKDHCENKDAGCTQRFLQKDLSAHQKICEFRSVSLCKWMGFKCDFTASKVEPLIEHLESRHNAQRVDNIVWNVFSSSSAGSELNLFPRSIYLQKHAADQLNLENIWSLILSTRTRSSNKPNFVSYVPILLHDGRLTAEYEFCLDMFVENDDGSKRRRMSKWIHFPSNYKDAKRNFLRPSFQLTTHYIKKQALMLNGSKIRLRLECHLSATVKPIPAIQQDKSS